MATEKTELVEVVTLPLIQIDDDVREMTNEEYSFYLESLIDLTK